MTKRKKFDSSLILMLKIFDERHVVTESQSILRVLPWCMFTDILVWSATKMGVRQEIRIGNTAGKLRWPI